MLREQDKHFLWSLYVAIGVIFIWRGIWEGVYEIPYINAWTLLFLGLTMLTFSGLIFKEFDPLGGIEKSTQKTLHFVYNHPTKQNFQIHYYDKLLKKELTFSANQIKHLEKDTLIIQDQNNQELFIPIHRITEIKEKNKTYWKL
jgi:uncharacterized protein (UPF0248 family)